MNWEWLVQQGLISGDWRYYAEGGADSAAYSHAIQEAYQNADDAQRRTLVDMLWATGKFAGSASYWYTKRTAEIGDLAAAAGGLTIGDTAGAGNTVPEPSGEPGTGRTPETLEEEVRAEEEAAAAAAAAAAGQPPDPTTIPPGEPAPGVPAAGGGGSADAGLSRSDLQAIYYWLPAGALSVFVDTYIDKGADAAWAAVRQHGNYEVWFPGNMDDNGNIRYQEDRYQAVRESYRDVMRSVGIESGNISAMEGKFVELMEGEVSPDEFQFRVDQTYNRIVSASEQIKQYYADEHGISGLSTQDLLFAAMDPEFGRLTLEEGFRIAEVGGAALESGFDIEGQLANLISDRGVNLAAARELFGTAQHLVPILDTLAQRHNDPDDDFDIQEFVTSEVFNDPAMNLRMRRLMASERGAFSRTGSFVNNGDAITGLAVA